MLILQGCYKTEVIFDSEPGADFTLHDLLYFDKKPCLYDAVDESFRYAVAADSLINFEPLVEFQQYSEVFFDTIKLVNGEINALGTIKQGEEYPVRIISQETEQRISLSFTSLPLVRIITPNTIHDEPKVSARLEIFTAENDALALESFIGIEYMGSTSQQYKKKSYGISFLSDPALNNEVKASPLGLKANSRWKLDAMYIDKLRMRNKTSFELWSQMRKDNDWYSIDTKFCELFLNNRKQGLYAISEIINAQKLNLYGSDEYLYKAYAWADGATRFETSPGPVSTNTIWEGWEQIYPNGSSPANWEALRKLRAFVVESSDEDFRTNITYYINIENFIDYFLLLNLVAAHDNTGKNTFLLFEDDDPARLIPWDLDGSWGIDWTGACTEYQSVLSNNIYDRLLSTDKESYSTLLKNRWFELRDSIFSEDHLRSTFEQNILVLQNSKIISKENMRWDLEIDLGAERTRLHTWISNRLSYLDAYFSDL